jgi:bifunctional DNase/RNase
MKTIFAILMTLIALSIGISIGTGIVPYIYGTRLPADGLYEVSTEGFVVAEPKINGTTVYLISGCNVVSFDVTQDQAYSIAKGLEKATSLRPLTHDIMKDVFSIFDIKLLQVRIDRHDDEVYKATMILSSGNKILELDARPSDSIAMATRYNIPIYFDRLILESRGALIC